jgi:hypothetical protein
LPITKVGMVMLRPSRQASLAVANQEAGSTTKEKAQPRAAEFPARM